MKELDKLIGRAFPDELRNVEPVDIDEDVILRLTRQKLGLEDMEEHLQENDIPQVISKPHPKKENILVFGEDMIEAPPARPKRYPWLNYAGWAAAVVLLVVCGVTWVPWLMLNLGFGTGPRSAGDGTSGISSSSQVSEQALDDPSPSSPLTVGQTADVSIYPVFAEYVPESSSNPTAYFTLCLGFSPLSTNSLDVDLSLYQVTLYGPDNTVIPTGNQSISYGEKTITLTYYASPENKNMTLNVSQLVPLQDGSGQQAGFSYQQVEVFDLDLEEGTAVSLISGKERSFQGFQDTSAEPVE